MPNIPEKFKTMHNVFDDVTNRVIYKLIGEGHFEGLESAIKIGKEANIFTAKKGDDRVIVKIYRVNSCNFKKMFEYIKADPRYLGLQGKRRLIIFSWVQREYRNLLKAREAEVRVPTPIAVQDNVVVMSFIGTGDEIAPQLKDQIPEDPQAFLDDLIAQLRKLHKAGIVHADLSQFNILNDQEKPILIDFSQGTSTKNPHADEYLKRDIKNIAAFFRKQGVKVDEEEIFKKIKLK